MGRRARPATPDAPYLARVLTTNSKRRALDPVSDSQTPVVLDRLIPVEQQVADAARRGDRAGPDAVLPMKELTTTEGPALLVRADLIRILLMGRRGELDPRDLRSRVAATTLPCVPSTS